MSAACPVRAQSRKCRLSGFAGEGIGLDVIRTRSAMRRRELILVFAAAAGSRPLAAGAQQSLQVRRIGIVIVVPRKRSTGAAPRHGLPAPT
jgi:hypothetical protein